MTDVAPLTVTLGETTTISGSGDLSKTVAGGTFSLGMTGLGGAQLVNPKKCKGDASQSASCKVGLGPISVGTMAYGGVTFPVAAGHVDGLVKDALTLAKGIPDFATKTTTTLKVADTDGTPMICVEIFSAPASAAVPSYPFMPLLASPLSARSTEMELSALAYAMKHNMPEVARISNPNGDTLTLTWKDCGDASTLAKVTDVAPLTVTLGETTTISGSGDLSKTVAGGTFSLGMTGLGGAQLVNPKKCKGDASQSASCKVGLGPISVGTMAYGGVTFPVAAGHVDGLVKDALTLAKGIPDFATKTTTTLKVADTDGTPMICVEIFSAPASTLVWSEHGLLELPTTM